MYKYNGNRSVESMSEFAGQGYLKSGSDRKVIPQKLEGVAALY